MDPATKADIKELELRVHQNFATRDQVEKLEETVSEHSTTISRLELYLKGILSVLTKIAWLLATPIILGIGYAGYEAVRRLP
jgi:hypothetical protein